MSMNHFQPGDIVVIEKHMRSCVIGRSAEVTHVWAAEKEPHPYMLILAPGETWYLLIDVQGEPRAAAHSWLRRVPYAWQPATDAERTHSVL